jgi:hypothetical protein
LGKKIEMIRIISHLNSKGKVSTIEDICACETLSRDNVEAIIRKHSTVFIVEGDIIKYYPPFNISNKQSLLHAIDHSFPKGIRHSVLSLCYQFATSDLNDIKYEGNVFVLTYGKTKEEIVFPRKNLKRGLQKVWKRYFDPFTNVNDFVFGLKFEEVGQMHYSREDDKLIEQKGITLSEIGKIHVLHSFYKPYTWNDGDIIKSKHRFFKPSKDVPFMSL